MRGRFDRFVMAKSWIGLCSLSPATDDPLLRAEIRSMTYLVPLRIRLSCFAGR